MIFGFDAKRAFCNFTGLGNYSRWILSALAAEYPEHRYRLYTPHFRPHPELGFADREVFETVVPQGLARKGEALWRSFGLAGEAARSGVALFHGLSGELPWGLRKRGIRSIVTIHDLIFFRYPEFYKPIDRWIYRRKFSAACRAADLVVAISEATKRDLVERLGVDEGKIRLVFQGCDPRFYRRCSDPELRAARETYGLPETYILSVGTIESRKNLLTLVRALPRLPREVSLVALGRETPYARLVREEIAKLGLEERVRIIPKSAFRDLPALYQGARVFVMPSLFEGFGIPILEALNSGVPVVAANTSSLPEAGGPGASYVEAMEPEAYAEAIAKLLPESEARTRAIAQGHQHALRFREAAVAADLWRVYGELVSLPEGQLRAPGCR